MGRGESVQGRVDLLEREVEGRRRRRRRRRGREGVVAVGFAACQSLVPIAWVVGG